MELDDPCEYKNIAEANPTIVDKMKTRLEEYQSTMISPHIGDWEDKRKNIPANGVWSTGWCESEPSFHGPADDTAIKIIV